jgi:3-hydroxybutyryl-CoA dehydrogenase
MFDTVAVVGAGRMGRGIAEVCARAGLPVIVYDRGESAADAALAGIRRSLVRAEERGILAPQARESAAAAVTATAELSRLAEADLVIEAAVEDEEVKAALFRRLDEVVHPGAVLASNTSSIPIARIAAATARPDRVVGLHFFNPAPVMPLVEVVASLRTSADTEQRVSGFAADVLGKKVVRAQDRAGFVVNTLLVPYLFAAIRMLASGTATAADIDTGMTAGCAHPMGPLRLADLVGLDILAAIGDTLYDEYREVAFAPPPLLRRMVEAGLLGRKTGRGFFDYPAA